MSATNSTSMRDALYESPGPHTRRRIRFWTAISLVLVAVGIGLIVRRFYVTGQLAPRYWELFARPTTWIFLGKGFLGTIEVSLMAGLIAIVLGFLLMLGRMSSSRVLSGICRVIINFFRGVPSLLLIYFFFLVVPTYGVKMSSFWMITLPVGLAASGVLAEVFRGGMNAVPKGQSEAAYSLGMRKMKVTMKIVFPQAVRYVIPSLISQLVVVVKDTTVAYVVSFPDMLQNARVLITNYDALVSVYFVVAILYILVNYAINHLAVSLARRSGSPQRAPPSSSFVTWISTLAASTCSRTSTSRWARARLSWLSALRARASPRFAAPSTGLRPSTPARFSSRASRSLRRARSLPPCVPRLVWSSSPSTSLRTARSSTT